MSNFYDIYGWLGKERFDKSYSYSFRQGETEQIDINLNDAGDLDSYNSIGVYLYSNDTLIHKWSGSTDSYLDEDGEIYISGDNLKINLSNEKSKMIPAGIIKASVITYGATTNEYYIYLGVVFKGYSVEYP
jgi:hypothetical protein